MSILKADLLQNRAGTRPPGVTAGDFAKAFGAIYTGTFALQPNAFGVSSATDIGPGQARYNYTLPFTAVPIVTTGVISGFGGTMVQISSSLTTSITTAAYNTSAALSDDTVSQMSSFGAQA